jgi:hypothetical protein
VALSRLDCAAPDAQDAAALLSQAAGMAAGSARAEAAVAGAERALPTLVSTPAR